MNLRDKVIEVQKVFSEADDLIKEVQQHSGVSCLAGCGRCCHNPKIEAYTIEFLPLAWQLNEDGIAEDFLEELTNSTSDLCPVYKPSLLGSCSNYTNRGLICRLFGSGAMRVKSGEKKLITCKEIKAEQPEKVASAEAFYKENDLPVTYTFYNSLNQIEPSISSELFPIKEAVMNAIEYVLNKVYYEKLEGNYTPPDNDNDPLPIPA